MTMPIFFDWPKNLDAYINCTAGTKVFSFEYLIRIWLDLILTGPSFFNCEAFAGKRNHLEFKCLTPVHSLL